MEKPKCQLCGNRHYSYEPCQWNDDPEKAIEKAEKRQSSKERVKRWQKKHREAYNAKMREYRRNRKARKEETKR